MTEVLDTIRELSIPLTVARTTGETVIRGFSVPGTTSVTGIEGHLQPLSPKELRTVPEGMNTLEWYHIWSLSEVKVDDLVTDGFSVTLRVVKREYWKEGPFWHSQGVKVEDELSRVFSFTGIGAITLPGLVPVGTGTHTPP